MAPIDLYFKKKEDILTSLFQEKLGELVKKFNHGLMTKTARECGRKVCEIHFGELENNIHLAYLTQIELSQTISRFARKLALHLRDILSSSKIY